MTLEIPDAVQRRLVDGPAKLAWIVLADGVVQSIGGAIGPHALQHVKVGAPLPDDIVWASSLTGELPVELRSIAAQAVAREGATPVERVDVLAWREGDQTLVLLNDSSLTARLVGEALQQENDADFLRERLAGAERMRRGERRSRSEALRALGYEILERGPDGAFRPTAVPAPWLDQLMGWTGDEERIVDSSDAIDFLGAFIADSEPFFSGASGAQTTAGVAGAAASAAPFSGAGTVAAAATGGSLRSGIGLAKGTGYVRTLRSSGVWTEVLGMGDGATSDVSFEAHAIVQSDGRALIAVERLDGSLEGQQATLQRQRDAQLSYEGLAREIQVKDVLLHCIVHDLRGPLSGLVGSLSLLEGGKLDREDEKELIAVGLRQARRQEEMIRHILEVFSAEYEALRKFEVDSSAAPDAVEVVRECLSRQQPAFDAEGVTLALRVPHRIVRVIGRADRLDRILANLLGNALRHAPKGSVVDVGLTPREAEDGEQVIVLSVEDRGPGVPEEVAADLFARFVQGGSKGAAGLGLFYIRMTVERWGGRCWYEARDGGGAAFFVELRTPAP